LWKGKYDSNREREREKGFVWRKQRRDWRLENVAVPPVIPSLLDHSFIHTMRMTLECRSVGLERAAFPKRKRTR
jgi:hypothetical protein